MLKLKVQTDGALDVLLYLANQVESTKEELGSATWIEENQLDDIIVALSKEGWIDYQKDHEEISMVEKPENITMLNVMETMEDTMEIGRYGADPPEFRYRGGRANPLNRIYRDCQNYTERYFGSITLQDLLDKEETYQ
jgi:DNA-binding IscR family transcriptional regulator